MDLPDLLPSDLEYCRSLTDDAQLLPQLTARSDEHLICFFEVASDDESWTGEHQRFMQDLLRWLTTEYAARRLAIRYGQRVVQCIHAHPTTLLPLLPKDLEIQVKDLTVRSCSLLYAVLSPFLRDLIEHLQIGGKPFKLAFREVPTQFLQIVQEFVTTGQVENLWKLEQPALERLLVQAGLWQLDSLEAYITDVMKRYINRQTIADFIILAQQRHLKILKQLCAEMLNQMPLGLQLFVDGESLKLIVEELMDPAQPIIKQMAPIITHLGLRRRTADSLEVHRLIPACQKLVGIDLEGTAAFPQELVDLLPVMYDLNLADCTWLTNSILEDILTRFPYLHALNLSGNSHLGFEGFRKIGDQKDLERLVCVYCTGLNDDVLEILARGCVSLVDLNISWCNFVTDTGIRALGNLRPGLRIIDISHCASLTDIGIHDLVRPCYQLQELRMEQLPLVTETGIVSLVALSPQLKRLDVHMGPLGPTQAQALRQRYPNLHVTV